MMHSKGLSISQRCRCEVVSPGGRYGAAGGFMRAFDRDYVAEGNGWGMAETGSQSGPRMHAGSPSVCGRRMTAASLRVGMVGQFWRMRVAGSDVNRSGFATGQSKRILMPVLSVCCICSVCGRFRGSCFTGNGEI